MFSRFSVQFITSILIGMTIVTSGCNIKTGEEPPPPKTQEFNGTKCLTRVSPYLSAFIDGKTTDAQVNETWTCFSTALDKFRKYVRGSSEDRYSSQELATFLQDNFLDSTAQKPRTITPALQIEFMKLKQLFVGGSREFLTMDDLNSAVSLIESFRNLALGINSYMKVFALNWAVDGNSDGKNDMQYFESANEAIQVFAKDLSALIQKNHQGYTLTDFVVLCSEMSDLADSPWASVAKIEKYMPVVQKVKKAISGGLETTVAPNEWRSFLLLSARGYIQFLRYHYFIDIPNEGQRTTRLTNIARMVEDGFSVFQDLVKEKPSGVVTRQEIAELLSCLSQAWPTFKTSDRLVLEAMKVKNLVIGGSLDSFTTHDFGTAGLKVGRLKDLIEKSLPYFSVYSTEWKPAALGQQEAITFFSAAQKNLSEVAFELGSLFEGDYEIESINLLVSELVKLYPSINDGRKMDLDDMVKKFTPIIEAAKNMAFNDSGQVIKKSQWPGSMRSMADAYSVSLYSHYFVSKVDTESRKGLRHLGNLLDQSVNLLQSMLSLNSSKKFTLESINRLSKQIVRAGLLPDKIDTEVLRVGMNLVVNRVLLEPELRIRGKYPSALNAASLSILSFEFKVWLNQALFFADLSESSYSMSSIQRVFEKKYRESGLSKELNTGLNEMIMALDSAGVPMTMTSKGYLVISGKQTQRYDRQTLSQLNLNRTIARLLIRSYANDVKRMTSYKGVTLSESQRAFKEWRPIVVRMGIVDPANSAFADARFREANIFAPSGNGDSYLSFKEGTELIGMVWSGVRLNQALAKELQQNCLGGHRYSNDTLISVSCVNQVYERKMPVHMKSSLPEHVKYMNAIDSGVWGIYLNSVLRSAGYVPNSSGKAKMRDIALATHIVQYIEMMFAKFDRDNNYFINTQESLRAFPTFKNIIREFAAGAVGENDLDSVFTYILRYGKPPETAYEKMQFVLKWKGKPNNWDVNAERTLISKILGYIADQTAKPFQIAKQEDSASTAGPAKKKKPRFAGPHQR